MKSHLPPFINAWIFLAFIISLTLITKSSLADEDCRDPIETWQSREVLKKALEGQGWVVKRIRIDDGCYQVRAIDDQGRRVEAVYAPADLTLQEFEVEDDDDKGWERKERKGQRKDHESRH